MEIMHPTICIFNSTRLFGKVNKKRYFFLRNGPIFDFMSQSKHLWMRMTIQCIENGKC